MLLIPSFLFTIHPLSSTAIGLFIREAFPKKKTDEVKKMEIFVEPCRDYCDKIR